MPLFYFSRNFFFWRIQNSKFLFEFRFLESVWRFRKRSVLSLERKLLLREGCFSQLRDLYVELSQHIAFFTREANRTQAMSSLIQLVSLRGIYRPRCPSEFISPIKKLDNLNVILSVARIWIKQPPQGPSFHLGLICCSLMQLNHLCSLVS